MVDELILFRHKANFGCNVLGPEIHTFNVGLKSCRWTYYELMLIFYHACCSHSSYTLMLCLQVSLTHALNICLVFTMKLTQMVEIGAL